MNASKIGYSKETYRSQLKFYRAITRNIVPTDLIWHRWPINCYKYKHHCDLLSMNCHAYPSRSLRAPPCCTVGRFISGRVSVAGEAGSSRHVSVAGSHGPAKPVFCRYRQGKASSTIKTMHCELTNFVFIQFRDENSTCIVQYICVEFNSLVFADRDELLTIKYNNYIEYSRNAIIKQFPKHRATIFADCQSNRQVPTPAGKLRNDVTLDSLNY